MQFKSEGGSNQLKILSCVVRARISDFGIVSLYRQVNLVASPPMLGEAPLTRCWREETDSAQEEFVSPDLSTRCKPWEYYRVVGLWSDRSGYGIHLVITLKGGGVRAASILGGKYPALPRPASSGGGTSTGFSNMLLSFLFFVSSSYLSVKPPKVFHILSIIINFIPSSMGSHSASEISHTQPRPSGLKPNMDFHSHTSSSYFFILYTDTYLPQKDSFKKKEKRKGI